MYMFILQILGFASLAACLRCEMKAARVSHCGSQYPNPLKLNMKFTITENCTEIRFTGTTRHAFKNVEQYQVEANGTLGLHPVAYADPYGCVIKENTDDGEALFQNLMPYVCKNLKTPNINFSIPMGKSEIGIVQSISGKINLMFQLKNINGNVGLWDCYLAKAELLTYSTDDAEYEDDEEDDDDDWS